MTKLPQAPPRPGSSEVNNIRNEHPDLICRAEGNEGGSAPAPVERNLF
jgi:hypothetical protein